MSSFSKQIGTHLKCVRNFSGIYMLMLLQFVLPSCLNLLPCMRYCNSILGLFSLSRKCDDVDKFWDPTNIRVWVFLESVGQCCEWCYFQHEVMNHVSFQEIAFPLSSGGGKVKILIIDYVIIYIACRQGLCMLSSSGLTMFGCTCKWQKSPYI